MSLANYLNKNHNLDLAKIEIDKIKIDELLINNNHNIVINNDLDLKNNNISNIKKLVLEEDGEKKEITLNTFSELNTRIKELEDYISILKSTFIFEPVEVEKIKTYDLTPVEISNLNKSLQSRNGSLVIRLPEIFDDIFRFDIEAEGYFFRGYQGSVLSNLVIKNDYDKKEIVNIGVWGVNDSQYKEKIEIILNENKIISTNKLLFQSFWNGLKFKSVKIYYNKK